jgi:glycosyltransferase involved in cell wall biosynthesis
LGYRFTLLTFEKSHWTEQQNVQACQLRKNLEAWGIDWRIKKYHQTPILPASLGDIVHGTWTGLRLIHQKHIQIVHTRSYIPSAMAINLKSFTGARFLFDMRGLMPREYVSMGYWTTDSLGYRIAKRVEARALKMADAIVVTSPLFKQEVIDLDSWHGKPSEPDMKKLVVISNCVDTEKFRPDLAQMTDLKSRYGLAGRRILLLSSGGLQPWHQPEAVIGFYQALRNLAPDFALVILTRSIEYAKTICLSSGLEEKDYRLFSISPDEMPEHILMAEAGISFLKPGHEMASPIKLAEYLACGVPVVISPGQGGISTRIASEYAGVVVQSFKFNEYNKAARDLLNLLENPATRQRCRQIGEDVFSLRGAVDQYAQVYQQITSH